MRKGNEDEFGKDEGWWFKYGYKRWDGKVKKRRNKLGRIWDWK